MLAEEGAVSLPYSWLQGEFDSFSSVTLKVSFSTPGCYRPDGFKPPPGGRKKKEWGRVTKLRAGMLLDGDKNDISLVHRHWLMLHYTLP